MSFLWGDRKARETAEEIIDPAAEAAAVERLQRMRDRAEPPSAGSAPMAVAAPATSLSANAFAVLGLTLDAGAGAIGRAHDDLSFEPGQDPACLDAARAALLAPRDRLEAELGWLPGAPARPLRR